jgi:hypothetical protein
MRILIDFVLRVGAMRRKKLTTDYTDVDGFIGEDPLISA